MRDDIARVLVTRPRVRGWGQGKKEGKNLDLEDLPSRESLKRRHIDPKELNEYLSPLRRFIEGCEGRRWDDVYSEVRERIKPGNTIHEHILTHLYQYVKVKVMRVEVSRYAPCGLLGASGSGLFASYYPVHGGDLYVDGDGIVKRAKATYKRPSVFKPKIFHQEGGAFYRKSAGIWYQIILVELKIERIDVVVEVRGHKINTKRDRARRLDRVLTDVVADLFHGLVHLDDGGARFLRETYAAPRDSIRFATDKRQLSSRELQRLKLSND